MIVWSCLLGKHARCTAKNSKMCFHTFRSYKSSLFELSKPGYNCPFQILEQNLYITHLSFVTMASPYSQGLVGTMTSFITASAKRSALRGYADSHCSTIAMLFVTPYTRATSIYPMSVGLKSSPTQRRQLINHSPRIFPYLPQSGDWLQMTNALVDTAQL